MAVLIICPYPPHKAPSQRFRFEQYLDLLEGDFRQVSFWNDDEWPKIYKSGNLIFKIVRTLLAFLRRFFLLFSIWKYDQVFIHREATPIGPPWFEWLAAKVFRKQIIYDFDDAIWLPNASAANQKLIGFIKSHSKVSKICKWATIVSAGNKFLADFASQFCEDVRTIPTTIDTTHLHIPSPSGGGQGRVRLRREEVILSDSTSSAVELHRRIPTIGWTGTHSTLKQLIPLFPILEKLHSEIPFNFLLIADQAPEQMPDFIEFCPWNKTTEIQDLMRMDIGIMPLFDSKWEQGKCGFKALQYMALGIPAIVSNVGVNSEIVQNGIQGFVVDPMPPASDSSWLEAMSILLKDEKLRNTLGIAGRKKVQESYSVSSQQEAYLALFN